MTTDELIAEIERLDQAATPGPWRVYGRIERDGLGRPNEPAKIEHADTFIEVADVWATDEAAELIAAYRTLAVEAAARLRGLSVNGDAALAARLVCCSQCGERFDYLAAGYSRKPRYDRSRFCGPECRALYRLPQKAAWIRQRRASGRGPQ